MNRVVREEDEFVCLFDILTWGCGCDWRGAMSCIWGYRDSA